MFRFRLRTYLLAVTALCCLLAYAVPRSRYMHYTDFRGRVIHVYKFWDSGDSYWCWATTDGNNRVTYCERYENGELFIGHEIYDW